MQHRVQTLIVALSLFVGAALLAGCGPTVQIPVKPMPDGANFTGLWYSNYDDMTLVQKGDSVTGTFEYKDGGVIAGNLKGGVLVFDWTQHGDLSVGRREVSGKGYFVISDDGLSFVGKWGYGESMTDGGEWTADKATQDYSK